MKIILMRKYGLRINDQEIGKEVFLKNYKKGEILILDFSDVEIVTTAFFNSFISEIMKITKLNLKEIFKIKNASESIKNNLLISLELSKYYEN